MAFIVPALAAVGGGTGAGAAAVGALTIAGTAAGVYGAVQARQAGLAASAEAKAQSKTELVNAQQRDIERRRDLMRTLASQNAANAAGGIENSGSVAAIMRRDIQDAQNDLLFSGANTAIRQRVLRSRASNAAKQGNANAATSLLDTAGRVYRTR